MGFFGLFISLFVQLFAASYTITDTVEFEKVFIEYGNVQRDSILDGYLKIYDKNSGELKNEVIYDNNNGYDLFKYLAVVSEDVFFIICDTYYLDLELKFPVYQNTVLIKYNVDGEKLQEEYVEQFENYYNHNYLLIVESGEKQIIYDEKLNIIETIEIQKEHVGSFYYQFQGKALVNGENVEIIDINFPGYYEIKIFEKEYIFSFEITIHPDVKIEGEKYNEGYINSVVIYSFGDLFINNNSYTIGTEISDVGNYNLLVIGQNNYVKSYSFVILPDVVYNDGTTQEQLLENTLFTAPLRIFSNSQSIFLNNSLYNSTLIDSPGSYVLTLYGVNDYSVDISFTILPNVTGVENNQISSEYNINVFGYALLNGEKFTGSKKIIQNGIYKLELLLNEEIYETIIFTVILEEDKDLNEITYSSYFKYGFLAFVAIGLVLILRKK